MPETRKFSLFNIDGKNNKFWNITLNDDQSVDILFGSQGAAGQSKHYDATDKKGGRNGFLKQIAEKTSPKHHGGPYIENKVIEGSSHVSMSSNVVISSNLAQKAINDIGTTNKELAALIQYFTDVNIHNISEASGGKITYDTSLGKFKTTQGIITLDQIKEAAKLLDSISDLTDKNDFESSGFKSNINQYLSLIPQKGLVRQMNFREMFNSNGLKAQNDLLDGLESSYSDVIASANKDTGTNKVADKKLFDVQLDVVDDKAEFLKLRDLYRKTKGSHRDVEHYDAKKAYRLTINHMAEAFEKDGKIVGNIMRLWHGTKASNMLSILKSGMVLPRRGAAHVTGAMFGTGLYFSDQSTKSIRYATGAWGHGGTVDRKFMLLVDVAMGKYNVPTRSWGSMKDFCPKGYDSCFAKANVSGVMNNEMIVYRTSQANPVYFMEFTPYGK